MVFLGLRAVRFLSPHHLCKLPPYLGVGPPLSEPRSGAGWAQDSPPLSTADIAPRVAAMRAQCGLAGLAGLAVLAHADMPLFYAYQVLCLLWLYLLWLHLS